MRLLLTALLAGSVLVATAQLSPRNLLPHKRADHGIGDAHKVRHDASLSKTPKLVRKRYKMTHIEARKYRKLHGK